MTRKFIKLKDVIERTGISKSLIYARAAQGTFPKPVSLGCATSRWVDVEVDEWIAARIRERDEALSR